MSEYWKSLPRKFCEYCKCWFADNKVSIEFHERGKGHQENVKKKLKEIRKKGQKEYEAQRKLVKDMKKIEEAALKAFQKDIANDPSLNEEYEKEMAKVNTQKEKEPPVPVVPKTTKKIKKWYEAKTPEGHSYYWNIENGESQWTPPKNGYIALSEQNVQPRNNVVNENISESSSVGPQEKPDPYGKWTPIIKKEEPKVDLQLPEKSNNAVEVNITLSKEKTTFREKVISGLADEFSIGDTCFKKRKNVSINKRNVRKRTDDDDD